MRRQVEWIQELWLALDLGEPVESTVVHLSECLIVYMLRKGAS